MTPRRLHIERLVLRGTDLDPLHAERLRGLLREELTRLLDDEQRGTAQEGVPAAGAPEELAGPLARGIAAKLPTETAR